MMRGSGGDQLGGPFWRLWSASTLSNLADGVLKVSLPLVAVTLTDSALLVAAVVVALTLPWLLFALPAGAMADRVDRRAVILVSNLTRAGAVALLATLLLLGAGSIWLLLVVCLVVGTAETFHDTSAQAILPQIVEREQLSRANSRLQAAELTANEFVGPPLGGVLVAVGVAVAFTAPAGLWMVAVGVMLLVSGRYRVSRAPGEGRTTVRADIVTGARFLWRHRLLRTLAAMTGTFNLASSAVFAVLVLYVVGPGSAVGLSEAGYGLLLASGAAGNVLGALTAERIEARLGSARALGLGIALASLFAVAPAATADAVPLAVGFCAGGVGVGVFNVVAVSARQRITPDRLMGRVTSAYRLLGWGTRPLGAAVGGVVAQAFGLRAAFVAAAAAMLLTLIGMAQVTTRGPEPTTATRRDQGLIWRSRNRGRSG